MCTCVCVTERWYFHWRTVSVLTMYMMYTTQAYPKTHTHFNNLDAAMKSNNDFSQAESATEQIQTASKKAMKPVPRSAH